MNFGLRTPEDESQRVIDRALAAGIRVLDTANIYTDGESERVVGRALRRLPPSLRAEAPLPPHARGLIFGRRSADAFLFDVTHD